MMKIYTKTGDSGESGLIGGKRAKKDEKIFWVLGTLDELNALLGVSQALIKNSQIMSPLEFNKAISQVQQDLFLVGSEIAALYYQASRENLVSDSRVGDFEEQIDFWTGRLPELDNFILPGGCGAGANLHQARTVCRRAERELVALGNEVNVRAELYAYLNRLGDWLFVMARYVNFLADEAEEKI